MSVFRPLITRGFFGALALSTALWAGIIYLLAHVVME